MIWLYPENASIKDKSLVPAVALTNWPICGMGSYPSDFPFFFLTTTGLASQSGYLTSVMDLTLRSFSTSSLTEPARSGPNFHLFWLTGLKVGLPFSSWHVTLMSIRGMSSAAHANVCKFFFSELWAWFLETHLGSRRFPLSDLGMLRLSIPRLRACWSARVLLPKLRLLVIAKRVQFFLVLGRCQWQTISFSFEADTRPIGFFVSIPQQSKLARFSDLPRWSRSHEGFGIWGTCGMLRGFLAWNSATEFLRSRYTMWVYRWPRTPRFLSRCCL